MKKTLHSLSLLFSSSLDHPLPPRKLKDATRINHGAGVTQRLQGKAFPSFDDSQGVVVEVDDDLLSRCQLVADPHPVGQLRRVQLARGDAVAEEDARVGLCDDDASARCAHRDGGVLAGGAATEVVPADDDRVVCLRRAVGDEASGVEVLRQTDQRIGAELFVLVWFRRDERQVFGRDDLVGVDVLF